MSLLSKIKLTWNVLALGSFGLIGYHFYDQYQNPQSISYTYSDMKSKEDYISQLEYKLHEINGSVTPYHKYMIKATTDYTWRDIITLAHNGLYECPSAETVSPSLKCNVFEETAVMQAAINLHKKEPHGKSLADTINAKLANGNYLFSWVPLKRNRDTSSDRFDHSLFLAINILGGNPEYTNYNMGQTHYCNKSASTTKCHWHENGGSLNEMGKIDFNSGIQSLFRSTKNMSKHTFYTMKEQ